MACSKPSTLTRSKRDGYVLAVLAIAFTVTVALRAVPFAALTPLRDSTPVQTLAVWTPVGVLPILAESTLRTAITADPPPAALAVVAVAVTAAAHLLGGRRTLLSVGAATYVVLANVC